MLNIMQDGNANVAVRLDGAKGVAPYLHPKLASPEILLHKQAARPEEEIWSELAEQVKADRELQERFIQFAADLARSDPVVMAQLRAILDGPQSLVLHLT